MFLFLFFGFFFCFAFVFLVCFVCFVLFLFFIFFCFFLNCFRFFFLLFCLSVGWLFVCLCIRLFGWLCILIRFGANLQIFARVAVFLFVYPFQEKILCFPSLWNWISCDWLILSQKLQHQLSRVNLWIYLPWRTWNVLKPALLSDKIIEID